ncbi:hypothetical protein INR49_013338 [Caranx melampygus]|nr:hypothetical protein INR49_013338 [Caranx melampygus]
MLRAAPDRVLDGSVDIILRVALNDENTTILQVPFKVLGIVAVGGTQLLQHWVGLSTRSLAGRHLGASVTTTNHTHHTAAVLTRATLPIALVAVAWGNPTVLGLWGLAVVLVGLRWWLMVLMMGRLGLLAGLLAMAAQEVGLGGGMPIGVAPFPVAATAGPPITDPTALTPDPWPVGPCKEKNERHEREREPSSVTLKLCTLPQWLLHPGFELPLQFTSFPAGGGVRAPLWTAKGMTGTRQQEKGKPPCHRMTDDRSTMLHILEEPQMRREGERLRTFDSWPSDAPVTSGELAKAGFFFLGPGIKSSVSAVEGF